MSKSQRHTRSSAGRGVSQANEAAIYPKLTGLCQHEMIWNSDNTHTLKPFKKLGLDSQKVKKVASKLHVHSVNFAAKLVHTRRALSSTVINSPQESVSGQACNPPDPH